MFTIHKNERLECPTWFYQPHPINSSRLYIHSLSHEHLRSDMSQTKSITFHLLPSSTLPRDDLLLQGTILIDWHFPCPKPGTLKLPLIPFFSSYSNQVLKNLKLVICKSLFCHPLGNAFRPLSFVNFTWIIATACCLQCWVSLFKLFCKL